jgi:hypothetical protein
LGWGVRDRARVDLELGLVQIDPVALGRVEALLDGVLLELGVERQPRIRAGALPDDIPVEAEQLGAPLPSLDEERGPHRHEERVQRGERLLRYPLRARLVRCGRVAREVLADDATATATATDDTRAELRVRGVASPRPSWTWRCVADPQLQLRLRDIGHQPEQRGCPQVARVEGGPREVEAELRAEIVLQLAQLGGADPPDAGDARPRPQLNERLGLGLGLGSGSGSGLRSGSGLGLGLGLARTGSGSGSGSGFGSVVSGKG